MVANRASDCSPFRVGWNAEHNLAVIYREDMTGPERFVKSFRGVTAKKRAENWMEACAVGWHCHAKLVRESQKEHGHDRE